LGTRENLGISFLRFSESDVLNNLEGVWYAINDWIDKFEKTHPLPPLKRGFIFHTPYPLSRGNYFDPLTFYLLFGCHNAEVKRD
jgi:hypothetical protein